MISPGPGLLGGDAVERLGDVELGDAARARWCRRRGTTRSARPADAAVADAAEREAADVGRGVEIGDERLQRMLGSCSGGGMCSSSARTAARGLPIRRSPVGVELSERWPAWRCSRRSGTRSALVGVEVEEQLVDLVDDLRDARVGPVDLVDDEDRRAAAPRAPCAARSASAAAAPWRRRRAAAPRRPSSGRARPHRRSRRVRACRRC